MHCKSITLFPSIRFRQHNLHEQVRISLERGYTRASDTTYPLEWIGR